MINKYLVKLAFKIDPTIAKKTAKYLGKDLALAGGASVAGAGAGAYVGEKVNKKNPKQGAGWGAFAGSHIAAAPISTYLAYQAIKHASVNEEKKEKVKSHLMASFAGRAIGTIAGAGAGSIIPVAGTIAGGIGGYQLGARAVNKLYEKSASDDKPAKFKMPKDKPTIATKEELLDKIQDSLLQRDKIRADQETQVWKETKRTNDIKDKEVGKMDKLKIVADVTKEKIKAKAKAKGAKK